MAATGRRIAVAIDGGAASEHALRDAVACLRSGDTLYIVLSVELCRADGIAVDHMSYVNPKAFEEMNAELIEGAKKLVNQRKETYASNLPDGATLHCKLLTSACPKKALADWCRDERIEVLFVGTRNLSAIKRFALGSFSTYLAQNAPCSVYISRLPVDSGVADAAKKET